MSQLSDIEAFVRSNISHKNYKPLWLHEGMCVNISKWCRYELVKPDGAHEPLPNDTILGKGHYNLDIYVSHVYTGPHKGGQSCSLSMFITSVVFEPEQNLFDLINDIVKTPPCTPTHTSVPPAPVKAKPKRTRRRLAFDEIDGAKCDSVGNAAFSSMIVVVADSFDMC